ncbi:MAG TPA: sigma 54-interacting transcriptional regulator [Thermoanaerobaculia bacterium]|nr:sigma 54-interacting transcriptional regulator [Thermoanaerobaculia bacterium]
MSDSTRQIDADLVVNVTPALIFSARPDGYLDYFNERWLEWLGVPIEKIIGWAWIDLIHPVDRNEHLRRWQESIASGSPAISEARVRRANGEYRWMLHHSVPQRDESGRIVRWFGSSVDIEDLKRAEGKIRSAEKELRTIIETIPAYVWTATPDGAVDFSTESWFDRTGLGGGKAIGWEWIDNVHEDDRERVVAAWREAVATGRPFDHELRMRNAQGEYRWILVRAVALRDDSGAVVRWYGTITDIDDRKRAEEELRKLKDQLHNENIALREEISQTSMFEEIVGSSPALRRVLSLVTKVADTDSTVLITGETGTGKELIARAIHKRSRRASRPFVSVNCGAIPHSLITSELFGYEKGAFTGAIQRHLGRFELADHGTIFLDEAGELPPEAQVALLRVLQERTFDRVGGTRPVSIDVRVIAATNRDLAKEVADGSFRDDLYYRLSVFPVYVPPLRERAADIPVLVQYFTQRYAANIGKKIRKVSARTMDVLSDYKWPGNVRELQNVIQRAVILCDGDTLVVDETWLQNRLAKEAAGTRGLGRPSIREEKEMIESALAGSSGRVAGPAGAAAKLGIARSTLESRIRSLRIDKNRFRS